MLKQLPRLLAVAALVGAAVSARAADSELTRPYELHIVLHVADHKLLTDVFRERVGRELRDGMQAALGELATVKVDYDHPRLKDVLARGLERSLDTWAERSAVKTHFVLIDFSGVHYDIQARQHDGLTGRPGRVVRRESTRDRDFVAKAAGLLVAQDFGMVGRVLDNPDAQEQVRVELKAGALGSLARWVRKGQVFEIVPAGSTTALDWSLLQVLEPPAPDKTDGLCTCRLWHRYKLGALAGSQCLLLGTTRAPLRLHFVQDKGRGVRGPLNVALGMDVRRTGFAGEETTKLHKSTDPAGWVETAPDGDKGAFEDLAFVSITSGMSPPLPQVPVAVLDDRPVVIPVNVTADAGSLLAARRAAWERNVSDSVMVQFTLFREIEDLMKKPDGAAQALEKARAGLKRTEADLEALQAERAELVKEGGAAATPAREAQRLKDLEEGKRQLVSFLGKQDEIERTENDPKKKAWRSQVVEAQRLEKEAEVGKAIAIYKKVLGEGSDSPELRDHLEKLEKEWKPVSEEHDQARRFIYNLWPTLDTARLKEKMGDAQKAFDECRKAKDLIGPLRLFKATEAHAVRLKKELDALHPETNPDDDRPAELIKEVSAGLLKLASDIQTYLQLAQPVGG
jgi:hypothetical protein